jgi:hypothetical protein
MAGPKLPTNVTSVKSKGFCPRKGMEANQISQLQAKVMRMKVITG